uniref:Hypoxanthine phosphoribosyltransferase n=1 Tax=uncultured bacterium W5-102b TaxID=1130996 RepID=H9BWL2_9BACT|nr:hypoxanthine phosphoribosyltransferase [uncultured bacterium W5-102b]
MTNTVNDSPAPSSTRPSLGSVLYSADEIAARVRALGAELDRDYAGTTPVMITVLKGATVFAADLARAMDVPHEMDFLAVTTYDGDAPGDQVRILKDLQIPIFDRDVILVEDVIDTGLTLRFVLRWLQTHQPRSIKVCTLLDRPHRRLADIDIDYRGFTPPDQFYVGYGFDYQQRYRNLPDLVELEIGEIPPTGS